MNKLMKFFFLTCMLLGLCLNVQASEADLAIPDLHQGTYHIFGGTVTSWDFLFYGALIIVGTLGFSLLLFHQIKKLRAHDSMLKVAATIYATCRTYLLQQGKFLLMLFFNCSCYSLYIFLWIVREAILCGYGGTVILHYRYAGII